MEVGEAKSPAAVISLKVLHGNEDVPDDSLELIFHYLIRVLFLGHVHH